VSGEPAALPETTRLILRRFTLDDAAFIRELVNDPAWIRNIGNRNVQTLEEARAYLTKGPLAMYGREGFGLYAVILKESGATIGMCGLVKRAGLEDVDLGFAFLPEHRGRGYAIESATAVRDYATFNLGLKRLVAIVSPANLPSIRLLEKLGFRYERPVKLPGDDEEIALYALPAPAAPPAATPSR
jgi:[ribosomal protein S5]-alanine N-acetyltransferase